MPGLQKWMRWTEAAERFCRSGAPNLKNMSPRTRPVKTFSEKGGPQRAFEVRGQRHEGEKVGTLEGEKVRKKLTF
jgi:hypothetical protein